MNYSKKCGPNYSLDKDTYSCFISFLGGPCVVEAADLQEGHQYNVKCTFVETSDILFCQILDCVAKLEALSSEIENYCESSKSNGSLEEGSYCFSKFTKDEKWHRSLVKKVSNDGEVDVYNVDNGGLLVTVPVSVTRPLARKFSSIPRTAVKVKLHDVHTSDIDEEATKSWLTSKALEQPLEMKVISAGSDVVEVNLFWPGRETKSLNDEIYNNFALGDGEDVTPQSISETIETTTQSELISIKDFTQTSITTSDISGVEPLSDTLNETDSSLDKTVVSFPKPQVDEREKVLCTYVCSPTEVCFQLLKYESVLNTITELLVEAPTQPLDERLLKKNMAVIAQSVEDGNWYRAEVKSATTDGVDVCFIDFGNSEVVPPNNLRDIFDVRFMQPATCITCKLNDVTDVEPEKAKDWLEENCIDNTFSATFETCAEDSYFARIHFTDKKGSASVNEIVQSQFAASTSVEASSEISTPSSEKKMVYVQGTEVQCVTDVENMKWIILQEDTYEKVTCVHVNTFNMLSFQLVRLSNKMDKLMNTIANGVESLTGARCLEKNASCIAQFNDLLWYRARVLQPNEGYASVEFVDCGNIDDVIVEDIRVIKPEYIEEPVFCIKCRLADVDIPPENREDVVEYLTKTLVDDTPHVSIHILKFDGETRIADIVLIQQGQNINEFLRNNFGGVDTVLRDCNVSLFEKVKITIPPTGKLSNFWCLLNDSKDKRELMMTELANTYRSVEPDITYAIERDQTCCVLSQDEKWYRAVVENCDQGVVTVSMVDYGFSEQVPKSNLRVLRPEFFQLPIQGFVGSLFDLRPSMNADSWSLEAVGFFNEACKGDVLTATILNCTDDVRSVAITKSNGDTIYELLSKQEFAETNRV